MSDFVQIHLLTVYPPANLNRDDTGRPKTAVFGGAARLRVSSQSLKRAWRQSEAFAKALRAHLAKRTQRLGEEIRRALIAKGVADEKKALAVARRVAAVFGSVKAENDKNPAYTEQLAFVSPEERAASLELAEKLAASSDLPEEVDASSLLRATDTAVDIAMFGRMLADNPRFNREAAVQVAHAITTHRVTVEDDYYTAVDDLKRPEEDAGAGFVGEQAFGAGVFYIYICIDRGLLVRNLGGSDAARALGAQAIAALVEAAATVGPRGKQASFASRARAQYILAERGQAQPRTLGAAFLKSVDTSGKNDFMEASIEALEHLRSGFDKAYGAGDTNHLKMQVGGEGSLHEIIAFATAEMPSGKAPRSEAA
jgi:CRISPR system Cascade subunit CasC